MAKKPLTTVIDIGTEKIAVLSAQDYPETAEMRVVGVAVLPSNGIKKSQIVDLEKVIETTTKAVDAAERMAGSNIKDAFVTISGTHIASRNSKGVVAVSSDNQEIGPADVDRVVEAAQTVNIPPDRELIHIVPRDFTVDSQTGIKDPTGMAGIRLESEVHLITASSTAVKNTAKCLQDMGIEVDGFVFSGLAAAKATLSETEKELGIALVDIGAGTTAITVYVEGSLAYSGTLPVGARHLTQDIALGCRLSLEAAEKIKLKLSKDPPHGVVPKPGESKETLKKRRAEENTLQLRDLGIDEGLETINKKTVIEGIMAPRMKEIFKLLEKELRMAKLFDLIPAGVVLTGGGAETVAILEVAKRTLQLPARIGTPKHLPGLTHDLRGPEFASTVGALLYAEREMGQSHSKASFRLPKLSLSFPLGSLAKKGLNFIKSLLPWV